MRTMRFTPVGNANPVPRARRRSADSHRCSPDHFKFTPTVTNNTPQEEES